MLLSEAAIAAICSSVNCALIADIIKIDLDTGRSGQVIKGGKLLERKGLDYLHQLIKTGAIGAVAVFSPSRLYRDLTRKFYADFVNLLETYNIPLITFSKIYWPDEIYGKLVLAKNQAIEDNCSYAGGSVPFGFVVKETEDRKYFVVYEPHSQKIIFIFKRYRELNGNLPRLGRELQAQGFMFPAFDLEVLRSLGVEKAPYVTLRYKHGGYPCHTREALLSILPNPAYIGWYVYGGAIISKSAHDPIVEMDDFLYAFSRLSPINLDGTENVNRPKVERSYTSAQGLVETLLTCNGNPCYAVNNTYMVREHIGEWQSTTLSVPIEPIDAAISTAILGVLFALDERHKQGLSDDLYQQIEALAQEKQAEGVSLDAALKNIDAAIRGWELDKQSCRETGNKVGLDEANRQLKNLYAAREQAMTKADQTAKEQEELQKTMSLHQQIMKNWWKWPFERRRRYVSLIVESVTMQEISPHVLKVVLTYKPPIVCTLTGYVLRGNCGQRIWTDGENATIHNLYPTADRADILKAIPNRTWLAIRQQAITMGVTRSTWENTSSIPANRTYTDTQLIESLQAEYPWFGETIGSMKAPIAGVWQPFHNAVLNVNNIQHMVHRRHDEYSLPRRVD